jgi:hypothetical protein
MYSLRLWIRAHEQSSKEGKQGDGCCHNIEIYNKRILNLFKKIHAAIKKKEEEKKTHFKQKISKKEK